MIVYLKMSVFCMFFLILFFVKLITKYLKTYIFHSLFILN